MSDAPDANSRESPDRLDAEVERAEYRPSSKCPSCGYLADPGVCPECGSLVEPLFAQKDRKLIDAARRRKISVWIMCVLAAAFAIFSFGGICYDISSGGLGSSTAPIACLFLPFWLLFALPVLYVVGVICAELVVWLRPTPVPGIESDQAEAN